MTQSTDNELTQGEPLKITDAERAALPPLGDASGITPDAYAYGIAPAEREGALGASRAESMTTEAAMQEAIAAAQPKGIAVESTTVAGDQPRAHVVIARGPHDQPDEGIVEGEALIVAAHTRDEHTPA